jgi:hypothetical protein
MKPVLTPVEFSRLIDSYTLMCIGQQSELHTLKQRVIDAYTNLYSQLPQLNDSLKGGDYDSRNDTETN